MPATTAFAVTKMDELVVVVKDSTTATATTTTVKNIVGKLCQRFVKFCTRPREKFQKD